MLKEIEINIYIGITEHFLNFLAFTLISNFTSGFKYSEVKFNF